MLKTLLRSKEYVIDVASAQTKWNGTIETVITYSTDSEIDKATAVLYVTG